MRETTKGRRHPFIDLCRAAEAMKAQLKSISSASATTDNLTTEAEIHFVGTKHKREANKQAIDVAISTQVLRIVLHKV